MIIPVTKKSRQIAIDNLIHLLDQLGVKSAASTYDAWQWYDKINDPKFLPIKQRRNQSKTWKPKPWKPKNVQG